MGAYPTGVPTDGQGYSVGNQIGSDGTVAAIVTPGTATSATIYGLAASTFYNFRIFPFRSNGTSAATFNSRLTALPRRVRDYEALSVIKDQFNFTGSRRAKRQRHLQHRLGRAWSYYPAYQPARGGSKIRPQVSARSRQQDCKCRPPDQGDGSTARRNFPAFTSGKLYASALMSFNKSGTGAIAACR